MLSSGGTEEVNSNAVLQKRETKNVMSWLALIPTVPRTNEHGSAALSVRSGNRLGPRSAVIRLQCSHQLDRGVALPCDSSMTPGIAGTVGV